MVLVCRPPSGGRFLFPLTPFPSGSPSELGAIRQAVLAAWEAPRTDALHQTLTEYSWERAVVETVRVYEALLS
ncbi:MAG: hypothetical protein ACM3RP_09145 [Chitinophagales bacterium]